MKIKQILWIVGLSVTSTVLTFSFLSKKTISQTNQQAAPNFQAKTVAYNSPGLINFTDAAAKATPAVVHVKTSYKVNTSSSRQFYGDELFEWFFGQKGAPSYHDFGQQEASGSGSGVIISADGYIVTNNHVIDDANDIEVTLSNNKTYKAQLIGKDKDTDLAVLKIEETNLPSLSFANSDDIMVGEWVLAVGNPFNLSSTVTAGIVSAKGRNINILENYGKSGNTAIESFIQTDAAVNPGNSGGALVNTRGELMGINTAIATPTGTFAGYSFAVPANLVAKVVDDIREFGSAQRAYLGVSINNITNELAHELKLENMDGVHIAGLAENGAAESAGMQVGDVIIAINGKAIKNTAELQEKIAEYRPKDMVTVTYIRQGKIEEMRISLK